MHPREALPDQVVDDSEVAKLTRCAGPEEHFGRRALEWRRVNGPDLDRGLAERGGEKKVIALVELSKRDDVLTAALLGPMSVDRGGGAPEGGQYERVLLEPAVATSRQSLDLVDLPGLVDAPDHEEVTRELIILVGRSYRLDLMAKRLEQLSRIFDRRPGVRVQTLTNR